MNPLLFSIIIPTFNSGAKIASTAASILSQEQGLYELIVIDGGSTDDTLMQLQNKCPAVRWFSEPDDGIYDAMNKGIHHANGEYLYFLGAGDTLRPGVLRVVADKLQLLPKLSADEEQRWLVYGNVFWVELARTWDGPFDRYKIAIKNICHQAIFYQRGIFDRLGDYDLRYRYCSDQAFNIRCFGQTWIKMCYLDLTIADYEGGGASVLYNDEAFRQEWPALVLQHLGRKVWLYATYYPLSRRLQPSNLIGGVRRRVRAIFSKHAPWSARP